MTLNISSSKSSLKSLSNNRSVVDTSSALINPFIVQYERGAGNVKAQDEEARRYT